MRRTLIILIPAALGLAALTGCGSDGDAQAESSATAAPTTLHRAPTTGCTDHPAPPVTEAPTTVEVPAETVLTEPPAPVTFAVAAVVDGDTLDVVASEVARSASASSASTRPSRHL